MITIDLAENDDCILVENESETPKEPKKDFNFKKRLIIQVQRHRSLYDNKHELFSNAAKKDLVWKEIAKKLKSNVNDCKNAWFELRYDYQRYARKLRNYFIDGHKKNRKRPAMAYESELLFLWRFIGGRKTCKIPFEIDEPKAEIELSHNNNTANLKKIDDDLILVEQPVELIVIDEDDDIGKSDKQSKMSTTMKTLILQIKNYPELYDCDNLWFKDYTRKSYLWNAIASILGDKATKLMKCWIVMQTRYEWEICQAQKNPGNKPAETELQSHLGFFKEFILKNPDTVYKQSFYLKTEWHDPIDYFKDIYNLIIRMKKMSDIVHITDSLLRTPEKSKQYLNLWTEIASLKNSSPGQCETTWLIMRYFYWELMHMRLQNYQLTDKWYFETIITELYAISRAAQLSKQQELELHKQNRPAKKANKRSAQTNVPSQGEPNNKRSSPIPAPTTTQITPTIINNLQTVPATNSILTTQSTPSPQLTLPKITAAISLAPLSLNAGKLQIKQIPGPPALSPAPQPFNMPNGMTTGTAPSITTPAQSQMSISFNLPTQTKVTPISMPTLIRPLPPASIQPIRNTTHATISVRPRSALNPALPIMQLPPWPTVSAPAPAPAPMATANTNSIVNAPLTAKLLNAPPIGIGNNNYTPSTTSAQSIAAYKTTTVPPNIAATSSTIPASANTSNINMATTPAVTNADTSSQFPKITGAISLLNPNEILIELISSHNGNQLVVHGPSLATKYQLSMPMVAKFIREVLAIPMLHNKRTNQPGLINCYWEHVGGIFHLPVHICRACWNFLLENFDHFPQIAPLKDLMKPFQTTLNVWKESFTLFSNFDEECESNGWIQYEKTLPDVVVAISGYPVLYQDVSLQTRSEKLSQMETFCAWRTISLRFPKIPDIQKIWAAFKFCFVQYMNDLEYGIVNKWPSRWWRTLARMKFLVEARYSQNEPFYYIISNKMLEEIDKFAMIEMKKRYKTEDLSDLPDNEESNTELEDNEKKTNDPIGTEIPANAKSIKQVELGALVAAIQKHPAIYGKADNMEKYIAWKKVATELNIEANDCLFAFKHAVEKYFAYKKRDPVNRLRINEKYYKKLDEIVRSLPNSKFSTNRSKINIKTPFELNQSVDADNTAHDMDLVFPERYISDINMSNSPSNLVVKNWIFAIGNIPTYATDFYSQLKTILIKYLPNFEI